MKKYFLSFLFFIPVFAYAQASLMPMPRQIAHGAQQFRLDNSFHVVMNAGTDTRAGKAVARFLRRVDDRTHLMIAKSYRQQPGNGNGLRMVIDFRHVGDLKPGEDESYSLSVNGDMILLNAVTDIGVLRGLETFLQLIECDASGYFLQGVEIRDEPRFTWRGLMMDVGRHFMPVEVIKRNIDGMAMVKMNVLHLHLSEDQGFRIESRVFPGLHEQGSGGEYFTQEQIKDIIRYAADRGIRVVPEFDMPGHATSWFVGYPKLASAPGPYEIEKKFGVFDPVMDPTRKSTYRFLKKFLREMCALFPDEYFHIGGDENNGKQWDNNLSIREFMKKKGIRDNHELQNYFNRRVLAILKDNNKKMIGWDEILQPGLPADALIQSWRGKEGMKEAVSKGHKVILSNGYYIDLSQPAWKHYLNDPVPGDLHLTDSEKQLVLGGEATMWAEMVTRETVDSRIWPRTAAIAERLWSPAGTNDITDMYKRLETVSVRLEEAGLQHLRNREMMIRRLAPGKDIGPLKMLVKLVEPLKEYKRHSQGIPYSTDLPFSRLPDIASPESDEAREFRMLCEILVKGKKPERGIEIRKRLEKWSRNHERVLEIAAGIPALDGWVRMSERVKIVSDIGLECLDRMERRNEITDQWVSTVSAKLKEASQPIHESELMIVEPVQMLFHHALPK